MPGFTLCNILGGKYASQELEKNILYQENLESLRENEIKKLQGSTSFYIGAEVNYMTLQKPVA